MVEVSTEELERRLTSDSNGAWFIDTASTGYDVILHHIFILQLLSKCNNYCQSAANSLVSLLIWLAPSLPTDCIQ